MVRTTRLNSSSAMCNCDWRGGFSRGEVTSAYKKPSSSAHWKKTRHAAHTAAAPPKRGRINLAKSGSSRKRRNAPRKAVEARSNAKAPAKRTATAEVSTGISATLCVLRAPAPVLSVVILFLLPRQKAEGVDHSSDGLRIPQLVLPDHALERGGRKSFCRNLFVFFRLRLAPRH